MLTKEQRFALAADLADTSRAHAYRDHKPTDEDTGYEYGDFDDARRYYIVDATEEDLRSTFVQCVGIECKNEYSVTDGGDLCFNMLESGEISLGVDSIATAARMVAQRVLQA